MDNFKDLERKVIDRMVLFEKSRLTLKALIQKQKIINSYISSLKSCYKEVCSDPDNDYFYTSLDNQVKYINGTLLFERSEK